MRFLLDGASRSVFLVAFLGLLLAGTLLNGQSTTQSIQGSVTDSSGAAIQGAKVTITNTGTGVSRTVTTNEAGLYSFPLVPVGNYDVTSEIQGFKTETVKGARVDTAAQIRQDFAMTVGSLTE